MTNDHHEKLDSLQILIERRCTDLELMDAQQILDDLRALPAPRQNTAPPAIQPDREVWLRNLVALAGQSGPENEASARAFAESIRRDVSAEITLRTQYGATRTNQLCAVLHQHGGLVSIDDDVWSALEVLRGVVESEAINGCIVLRLPAVQDDGTESGG